MNPHPSLHRAASKRMCTANSQKIFADFIIQPIISIVSGQVQPTVYVVGEIYPLIYPSAYDILFPILDILG
jgi:hypothetical protein